MNEWWVKNELNHIMKQYHHSGCIVSTSRHLIINVLIPKLGNDSEMLNMNKNNIFPLKKYGIDMQKWLLLWIDTNHPGLYYLPNWIHSGCLTNLWLKFASASIIRGYSRSLLHKSHRILIRMIKLPLVYARIHFDSLNMNVSVIFNSICSLQNYVGVYHSAKYDPKMKTNISQLSTKKYFPTGQ